MSRHHMDDDELDSHVPLLTDHERHVSRDNSRVVSPAPSTVSAQSHEVKYIFDPNPSLADRDADAKSDYSHIHIKPKPRLSDGAFHVRPPPPAYHRHEANLASRFHYSFQGGPVSGNAHQFRSQPQAVSLEDVSGYDPTRRKSWSPPLLRQNVSGYQQGQKNVRSCYSSNMVDWETPQQGNPAYNMIGYPQSQSQSYPYSYSQGHPQIHYPQTFSNHPQPHLQSLLEGPVNLEEAAEGLPPRLAPVSGVPPEKLSRSLIRPIAFKPAYTRHRKSICQQCGDENASCHCSGFLPSPHTQSQQLGADASYPRSTGQSSFNTSQIPVPGSSHSGYRSLGYQTTENAYLPDDSPGANMDVSPHRKVLATNSEMVVQTPSPSDSGVGELEAMLKEREAEILTLRQVMDRNERAIFQVYEEKKSRWSHDMLEIREEYEHKLKLQQQKANKLEQALAVQVRRLQQEKLQMQGKYINMQMDKEGAARRGQNQNDAFTTEPDNSALSPLPSKPKHLSSSCVQSSPGDASQEPAMQDELAMKNTEIIALKSQLQALQAQLGEKEKQVIQTQSEIESKAEELKLVHEQLDQLSGVDGVSICEEWTQTSITESEGSGANSSQQPGLVSDEGYVQSLERQIDSLREQLQTAENLVETERMQWLEEKNKVVRYQKQLQLNYVQMQRKNTALEAEVEQLTLELESRHLKLAAMNGEESVC